MSGLPPQNPLLRRMLLGLAATLLSTAIMPLSHAALMVSATRVVFESDKRNVSVIIKNPSTRPFAVQTWVNTEADDTTTAVPFAASPPLFRLDPGKEQQVQINGLPNSLPSDRESLFFFNVQEIPEASNEPGNVLNVALRTRLKLFHRPSELKDNPMSRLKDLSWSLAREGGKSYLVVNNPSPYHLTFISLELQADGKSERISSPDMLGPLTSQRYALETAAPTVSASVTFSAINDYGGYSAPLTQPVHTTR